MTNPQKGKIILVDHTEVDSNGRGSYLKIYDMGGEIYRIAEKRSNLWDMFKNTRKAEPILTIFETYNNVEYIANARRITDDILRGAITTLGERATDRATNERNRSTSLSYAKDLVIGDKIPLEDMLEQAQKNYMFITTGQTNTIDKEE